MNISGFQLFDVEPNFANPPGLVDEARQELVEAAAGRRVVRYPDAMPSHRLKFRWEIADRVAALQFEEKLYEIAGRARPFFVPSWTTEFVLTEPVAAGATSVPDPGVRLSNFDARSAWRVLAREDGLLR